MCSATSVSLGHHDPYLVVPKCTASAAVFVTKSPCTGDKVSVDCELQPAGLLALPCKYAKPTKSANICFLAFANCSALQKCKT